MICLMILELINLMDIEDNADINTSMYTMGNWSYT